jgi:hypothetical protein
MKWKIYYDNGDTYAGDPYLAPATGVIVIAIEDVASNKGHRLTLSKDAYYYKDGRWWGCDDMGMYDYLMSYVGPKAVLFGRTIRDEFYWKIVNRATKEGIDV